MQINWNDDENRMMWYRSSIDPAEKSVMLAICREYVQEHWRDARIVYKVNRQGIITHAAIAIAKTLVDARGNYAKSQNSLQLITEWLIWNDPACHLLIEWELWLEAYGYCKYKQNRKGTAPQYDALTQHRANQQQLYLPTKE
jgi:hypothetical protein